MAGGTELARVEDEELSRATQAALRIILIAVSFALRGRISLLSRLGLYLRFYERWWASYSFFLRLSCHG